VSRRFHVLAVLCAWLLASGAQWDFVQVVAWGRMFAGYSTSMSLTQAAQRTLSGEMCGLCRAVHDAKQQQDDAGLPPDGPKTKLLLACPPTVRFVFTAPSGAIRSRRDREPLSATRAAPPTPPPRAA